MWFYGTPSCDLESTVPPKLTMSKIVDCWEVFGGRDGIAKLVAEGMSPFAGQRTREVLAWINMKFPSLRNKVTERQAGNWVLKHGASSLRGIDFAYRAGGITFARRVVAAISRNVPLTELELRVRAATKSMKKSQAKAGTPIAASKKRAPLRLVSGEDD